MQSWSIRRLTQRARFSTASNQGTAKARFFGDADREEKNVVGNLYMYSSKRFSAIMDCNQNYVLY